MRGFLTAIMLQPTDQAFYELKRFADTGVIMGSLILPVAWYLRPAQDGGEERSVIHRGWFDPVTASDVKEGMAMLAFSLLLLATVSATVASIWALMVGGNRKVSTRARVHAHARTHTRTLARTLARTHAHTHTCVCRLSPLTMTCKWSLIFTLNGLPATATHMPDDLGLKFFGRDVAKQRD